MRFWMKVHRVLWVQMMCYIFIWRGDANFVTNVDGFALRWLYLQLQAWVISHVNQQAVEGGQALRVSLTAGTPWTGVTNVLLYNMSI